MDDDEFVFHNNGGTIMSNGFIINSQMMSGGKPVMNSGKILTTRADSQLNQFAIPSNLALFGGKKKTKSSSIISNKDEVLSDDIYDKLLKMVELTKPNKKGTRKASYNQDSMKKTRKVKA